MRKFLSEHILPIHVFSQCEETSGGAKCAIRLHTTPTDRRRSESNVIKDKAVLWRRCAELGVALSTLSVLSEILTFEITY